VGHIARRELSAVARIPAIEWVNSTALDRVMQKVASSNRVVERERLDCGVAPLCVVAALQLEERQG
jgi:hypothetical protein